MDNHPNMMDFQARHGRVSTHKWLVPASIKPSLLEVNVLDPYPKVASGQCDIGKCLDHLSLILNLDYNIQYIYIQIVRIIKIAMGIYQIISA